MENLLLDLRYALRLIVKTPTFSAIAILTLALGIGANTAIFSVVNGILLKPLPYADPARLYTTTSNESYPDMKDFREQSRTIESIGLFTPWAQDLIGTEEPIRVEGSMVNGEFFATLGVPPHKGRTLLPEDDVTGTSGNAVISYSLWQTQFGGDQNIVGKSVNFSGKLYTIVGVMPQGFRQPRFESEVWLPVNVLYPEAVGARGAHFLYPVLRLKPGVTREQAQAEINAIGTRLAELYPEENTGRQWVLASLQERMVGRLRTPLLMLLGAAGLVLLIACANFANLLLARSAARRREVAVRAALGASRMRIVSQFLTESVVIALLGGIAGILVGYWGVDVLLALAPADVPRLDAVHLDATVLAFTFGVALLTGLVFGLAPAFQAGRTHVHERLKEGGRAGEHAPARGILRGSLVVAELSMAMVLLIGAGLLIQSFVNLMNVGLGFEPEKLVTFRLNLPQARYNEVPRQTAFWRAFLERANAAPGVESVATVSELPLSGNNLMHNMVIEGQPVVAPGQTPEVDARTISPNYFGTMGIPVLQGRALSEQDTEKSLQVAVVNQRFVREYYPNENPIGKQVRWDSEEPARWMTIVGVVGDVRHAGIDVEQDPTAYVPFTQNSQPWKRWAFVVVRPSGAGQQEVIAGIKQALWGVDSMLPVGKVQTMDEVIGTVVAQRRFNMLLLGMFAGLALLLAVVGIYGVMSYMVVQRTHEIGIRMALGARRAHVLQLIAANGLKLVALGVAIGVAGSLVLSRVVASLLFGVTATDAATYAAVALLLAAVGLAASLIPARRATKVDPMVALRYE